MGVGPHVPPREEDSAVQRRAMTRTIERAGQEGFGLAWLVAVRWLTLLAGGAALLAGRGGLAESLPVPLRAAVAVLTVFAISNAWLMWRLRRGQARNAEAGLLVCADVLLLSWLLLRSGGVLNPASVFFLVQIALTALVLGRFWTWIVTALAVGGYALLFAAPPSELEAAQSMHPEIGVHMRGMWLAFAITAPILGLLVTRLALAIERRDRALAALSESQARAARFTGLATLAAGAAHELSTPLSTMAVAARELERALEQRAAEAGLREDARLIRAEIDRCRRILEDMSGRIAEPFGERPESLSLTGVIEAALSGVSAAERQRVQRSIAADVTVRWATGPVARALANLIRNALQASPAQAMVRVTAAPVGAGDNRIVVTVEDRGAGMTAADLARAGEPFFTTKPPGSGTGLGLFVARSAIEQLGGSLVLTSRLGEGTTASITLPRDVVAAHEATRG